MGRASRARPLLHPARGVVVCELFVAGTLTVAATARLRAYRGTLVGLGLLLPGVGLLILSQTIHSMGCLLLGTTVAGVASGLGYRCGLQVVNENAPEDRRAEVVSAYLVVCYAAISLPVIGIGLVAHATNLLAADATFGGLTSATAAAALIFGIVRKDARRKDA